MPQRMTQVTILGRPILGVFGKGIKGSIALNYAESCSPDCDLNCPYHFKSISKHAVNRKVRCYAHKLENRSDRRDLLSKLQRHRRTNKVSLTASAIEETERIGPSNIPWVRISAFGPVPPIPPDNFRQFCEPFADGKHLHLPVESWAKTVKYRKVLEGLNVAVRRSCPTVNHFMRASIRSNPVAVVVGNMDQAPMERLTDSRQVAKRRSRRTSRKCIVCPAIAVQHNRKRSKLAKCGNCTACANPEIDIVYPAHR